MLGIRQLRDVPVPMRDGLLLAANVYLPDREGRYPVIMAFTSFGKDRMWGPHDPLWGVAYEPWSATLTATTSFEAEDPEFWVRNGYALVLVDPRGFGHSPGRRVAAESAGGTAVGVVRDGLWARDMYDAIQWAGQQPWSNGHVGLSGVSILGFSQWRVAAMAPPHLKAICPWEAMTDVYRDVMYPGGIPETRFTRRGYRGPEPSPAWPAPEHEEPPTPLPMEEDDFLARITVPALICGTWADHGAHTRGSFRAFRKIRSAHKWLYTHGRQKWATFYTVEAMASRLLFFDCFLKGTDRRILEIPPVRLEVREDLHRFSVRYERDFPVPGTVYRPLYLAGNGTLQPDRPTEETEVTYEAASGYARFDHRFERDTEVVGYMKLRLWASPRDADDMDLFVTVRKLDRDGQEVWFDSDLAPERWPVALGWLRLSCRELDPEKSTPWEPYLKSVVEGGSKVTPGTIVDCEIPILPSATLFRAGEVLRLEISGRYRNGEDPGIFMDYRETVNRGRHSLYLGGKWDSYLLVPITREA
ncbi:MAG: CocE/NonD family hydrolase [Armatimonadota bacterium]|nr:CocE/NonD family hydrolase [Armatimonadota bacterium]MDR7438910.1 CocE/NonD family hydrolase [Armatimonadota bacterium]MDR7562450.1 CocE/NonD family hydrolase [Armatimonadota bacterium]MDR7601163.1 CocE/NonD family hydrolase [Armatimonadota bacterium]